MLGVVFIMWLITYKERGITDTYKSDCQGGILSAIEDFYSKFGFRGIDKIEWVS